MKRLITTLFLATALTSCSQTPTNADSIRTGYQALSVGDFNKAEQNFKAAYAGFKEKSIHMGMLHALVALGDLESQKKNYTKAIEFYKQAYTSITEDSLEPDGATYFQLLDKQRAANQQLAKTSAKNPTASEVDKGVLAQRRELFDYQGFQRLINDLDNTNGDLASNIISNYYDGSFKMDVERAALIKQLKSASTKEKLISLAHLYPAEKISSINSVWYTKAKVTNVQVCPGFIQKKCEIEFVRGALDQGSEVYVMELLHDWSRIYSDKFSGWVETKHLVKKVSQARLNELKAKVTQINQTNPVPLEGLSSNEVIQLIGLYPLLSSQLQALVKPQLVAALHGKADFTSMLGLFSVERTPLNFKNAVGSASTMAQYQSVVALADHQVLSSEAVAANTALVRIYRSQADKESFREAYALSYAQKDLQSLFSLLTDKNELTEFISDYAAKDPGIIRQAKHKLATLYRSDKTFESYLKAFELTAAESDGKQAMSSAATLAQKQSYEQKLLTMVTSPEVLFDLSLNNLTSRVASEDGSGGFFSGARYRLSAFSRINGDLVLRPKKNAPLLLGYGTYKAVIETQSVAPVQYIRESRWAGNADRQSTVRDTKTHEVLLSPPNYEAKFSAQVADISTAMVERGIMGGYSAYLINGSIDITYKLVKLEPVAHKGSVGNLVVNYSQLTKQSPASNPVKSVYDTISASKDEMDSFMRIDGDRVEDMRREQLRN